MKNLQKMTKGQLKTFAAKQGVELDMNDTKKVMIANFNKAKKKGLTTTVKGQPKTNKVTQPTKKKSLLQIFREYWGL